MDGGLGWSLRLHDSCVEGDSGEWILARCLENLLGIAVELYERIQCLI